MSNLAELPPHEYIPASLGHSSSVCKWCHGTPKENAIIAPKGCDKRTQATEPASGVEQVAKIIFDMIRHGDEDHQIWLHEKCGEVAKAVLAALPSERAQIVAFIENWNDKTADGNTFLIARAIEAGEHLSTPAPEGLPPAIDGCQCPCHTQPGIQHFMACCGT